MTSDHTVMARAAARAAARTAVAALRDLRSRSGPAAPRQRATADGRNVVLQTASGRRPAAAHGFDVALITCGGARLGELWTRADIGTSTFEVVPRLDVEPGSGNAVDDGALTTALQLVVDDVGAASPELRVAVRRSLDPLVGGPADTVLTGLGFARVATFPGDLTSPQAWAGEDRWEPAGG